VQDELLTLAAELTEVVRLAEDDDVAGIMERFVRRAARTIPGCDQAMIAIRSAGGVEVLAGAHEERPDVLQPGPVIESLTFREPRRLDDTATDQRWPAFAAQLGNLGYRTCLVLPLVSKAEPTAVLALFSATPERFTDTSYDLVLLFTLHAGVAFDNASLYEDSRRLVEQLRTALVTRALIGSAQGLLMHRNSLDSERAFSALRTASQHSNVKLRELAGQLVTAHEQGDLDAMLQKLGLSG
jgi:GAF domain-containing protein